MSKTINTSALAERFKELREGESFFVPGVKPHDLMPLRKAVKVRGVGISIRSVNPDPKNGKTGVRVWRLRGEYDQL